MKKLLVISLLFISAVGFVFAEQALSLSAIPYAFHSKTSSLKDDEAEKATYSYGAVLGYENKLDCNAVVGFDFEYKNNWYENESTSKDLMFLVKGGYSLDLGEKVDAFADLKAGALIQLRNKKSSVNFPFGLELGASFNMTDSVKAFASVEGLFSFSKKDDVNYSNYNVNTKLGVSYIF